MGTTQRISPGVPNQPNWGSLNKSVTNIAKTIEKEKAIEQEELDNPQNKTPEQFEREYQKIILRRDRHLKSAFKSLVKTGGGAKNISRGKSNSIGRAGLKSSGKIIQFFSNASTHGLQYALNEIDFGSLEGKNIENVIDFLVIYCSDCLSLV